MTGIQLQYWQNVETARSHHMNEYLEWLGLQEQKRHNVEGERVNWFNAQVNLGNLQESIRSHKENESISWFNAFETQRSHKENEAIGWFNAYESQRTHQANEAISWFNAYETQRAHMVNEEQGWQSLALTERDVVTRENAQLTREAELAERTSHNLRADAVAAYANVLKEQEIQIKDDALSLDYAKWFGAGKDVEQARADLMRAQTRETNANAQDVENKQTKSGDYWDIDYWTKVSQMFKNYFGFFS